MNTAYHYSYLNDSVEFREILKDYGAADNTILNLRGKNAKDFSHYMKFNEDDDEGPVPESEGACVDVGIVGGDSTCSVPPLPSAACFPTCCPLSVPGAAAFDTALPPRPLPRLTHPAAPLSVPCCPR